MSDGILRFIISVAIDKAAILQKLLQDEVGIKSTIINGPVWAGSKAETSLRVAVEDKDLLLFERFLNVHHINQTKDGGGITRKPDSDTYILADQCPADYKPAPSNTYDDLKAMTRIDCAVTVLSTAETGNQKTQPYTLTA